MLIGLLAGAFIGVLLLFVFFTWFIWRESFVNEEKRIGALAASLGLYTESAIIAARDMLDGFNKLDVERCSREHLKAMQEAAISMPYIRAIGFWRANKWQCGAGFIQGVGLTPPRADRIYDNGVIAWWPGPHTEIGGVQLFLMRLGEHDVAIDPRMLLDAVPLKDQQAGLWVEGLPMSFNPPDANLPDPATVPPGLTVDRENELVVSRFSLGTLFPIDIVAVQPTKKFWERYQPTLLSTILFGLALLAVWIYASMRYFQHRVSLATELRNAVRAKKINVVYQPIVELESNRCVGAEALARWQRSDGEMVSPDVFIPVAEEAGIISDITLIVLKQIIHDLGGQLRNIPDLSINLNLSSHDLESDSLARDITRELDREKIPALAIKMEITERALIDSDTARGKINYFRRLGHRVAIDDFGTGYSSLSYLQTFELDTLKIDKAFVDAIEAQAVTSGVIVHVIEMAKSLGLDIVAEGIESQEQIEWLRSHGVRFGQGFFFSRPLSAHDLERYLSHNS